jgi:hypothetical protein
MMYHAASGMFTAQQSIGVLEPSWTRLYGISFKVRRRLASLTPWNIMFPVSDDADLVNDDDDSTWFQVQLTSPSRNGDSITKLRIETRLNDLLPSCKFGLQYEQALQP